MYVLRLFTLDDSFFPQIWKVFIYVFFPFVNFKIEMWVT